MKKYIAAAAALILCAPLAAFAADSAATTAPAAGAASKPRWSACTAEVQKFCANIEHGKGKIRSCLEGHATELSGTCKTRMAEHHEKPN